MTSCFFIGITLTSCEKDLYEDGIKNSSRDLTVTHVSLSGLDKTTSSKINEKITLLKNLSKKTNAQGRFEYNSALDIYIDTENGRLINNNGKLYYTFPMFRKTEENLENIIFAPLASGDMETYCAKYNVTPEVFKDLTIQEIENLNPTIQRIDANSFEYTCVTISWTVTTYPGCNYPDGMHSNGQQCDAAVVAYSMQFCNVSFGGGSVSNGVNSGPGVSGPSNSGPTGNGGANPVSGISTSPIGLSPEELAIKTFIRNLTVSQKIWYDNHPECQESINNLVITQNENDNGNEIAIQLINLSIANNSTFIISNTITPSNSENFDNINELDEFLNQFQNSDADNITIEDNGNNTKTSRFSFNLGAFAYLNVQVKQKLQTDTQDYTIENVSSSISGATLAMEWHQNDDDDVNVVGNVATVTFTGTLSLNCFVEGIGVFFSDNVTIECDFNIVTGELISGHLIGLD